jgi:murein DD-endopeptidase MepM/ murein hydrolase activator NlpD
LGNRLFPKSLILIIVSLALVSCATSGPEPVTTVVTVRDPSGKIVSQSRSVKFLMWPVARHKVSQNFRPEENSRKKSHDGIDISAPRGTRIYAPADGTVIYAGHKFRGYGKMIMIEHSPIFTTLYGHCQKLLVHSGEAVKRGNLIALVGRTGHATAPHLHFEVRVKREPVNPLIYLED